MLKKKNRIIFLVTVLLILGFLATSLASYFVSRTSLRKEIERNTLPLTSDNIYSEIQRDLFRPIFISSLMASDTFLRDWVLQGERDPRQLTRYLKEIQNKYGTFTSFFVSEKTRTYYQSEGILKKVHPDEERDRWYFRVRTMANDHEINVDPDLANKDALTIFINCKVYDYTGNYIGAAGVGLTVNAVKDLIETYQQRYGRDIYFIDQAGNITLKSASFAVRAERLEDIPGLTEKAGEIIAADSLTLNYQRDGQMIHLNTRFIKEFGWHLLVEQAEDETLATVYHALLINLSICALITGVVLLITHRALSVYQQRLETMALTDKLTGALNRQSLEAFFEQASAESRRTKEPLSLVLFDLDYFKKVNDSFGHQAGDVVLRKVAARVKESIRESDLFFRWGGEEFLVLLRDCSRENALKVAETIRKNIQAPPLHFEGKEIQMTASFGVTEYAPKEEMDVLIKRVDAALYAAKDRGRNCSVCA